MSKAEAKERMKTIADLFYGISLDEDHEEQINRLMGFYERENPEILASLLVVTPDERIIYFYLEPGFILALNLNYPWAEAHKGRGNQRSKIMGRSRATIENWLSQVLEEKRRKQEDKIQKAVKEVRKGTPLKKASKRFGVNIKTLKKRIKNEQDNSAQPRVPQEVSPYDGGGKWPKTRPNTPPTLTSNATPTGISGENEVKEIEKKVLELRMSTFQRGRPCRCQSKSSSALLRSGRARDAGVYKPHG